MRDIYRWEEGSVNVILMKFCKEKVFAFDEISLSFTICELNCYSHLSGKEMYKIQPSLVSSSEWCNVLKSKK